MKCLKNAINSRKKQYKFNSFLFHLFHLFLIHFIQNSNSVTKMGLNFHSVIVFLLMTTLPDSYGESVCDFILNDGKLRDLGLYSRFDEEGQSNILVVQKGYQRVSRL